MRNVISKVPNNPLGAYNVTAQNPKWPLYREFKKRRVNQIGLKFILNFSSLHKDSNKCIVCSIYDVSFLSYESICERSLTFRKLMPSNFELDPIISSNISNCSSDHYRVQEMIISTNYNRIRGSLKESKGQLPHL